MNNWQNKSDFEINKAVAVLEGLNLCEGQHYKPKAAYWSGGCEMFDPCNNPSDAWPIIDSIWDHLMSLCDVDERHTYWERVAFYFDCSKLRAAMIAYLEMNGVKP